MLPSGNMGQQASRSAFDSLLTKTHVQHALIQPDGRHNDVPTALATVVFLNGTPELLQAVYTSESAGLGPWTPSPRGIADEENKARLLGDIRFQRAYLSYFSMENGKFAGNSKALAMSHLLSDTKPLIFGLFAGLGRPLVLLSDAMELQNPIMVVQALTLSAVDWIDWIHDILSHPQLAIPATNLMSPGPILGRVVYDGRLSGIMKSGPGFHGVSQVFSSPAAKVGLLEYVHQLDCRDPGRLLQELSSLSVLLLCATHKVGKPAFDFYLSCLPTWVNSLRILLPNFQQQADRVMLIRGVWLLMLLAYTTQLRPTVDAGLLLSSELPENGGWELVFAGFHQGGIADSKFKDLQLLRALRSLWELGRNYDGAERISLRAAWKLVRLWQGWTGLGADREESLNIRL